LFVHLRGVLRHIRPDNGPKSIAKAPRLATKMRAMTNPAKVLYFDI
jgi:hypothetical protein